jgi:hypothetical protein
MVSTTSTYVPDALDTLRDSFALHLAATRSPSTSRIYLSALDGLRRRLADRMPTARAGPSRAYSPDDAGRVNVAVNLAQGRLPATVVHDGLREILTASRLRR